MSCLTSHFQSHRHRSYEELVALHDKANSPDFTCWARWEYSGDHKLKNRRGGGFMDSRERSSTFAGFVPSSRQWTSVSNNNAMSNGPPQSSASSIRTTSSIRSLRKRHSFFGRSNSDASRTRKPNGYHSSTPSQDLREEQTLSRSPTTLSTDTHRSTTETLVSIRNSIFGGRKNLQSPEPIERTPSNTSRPSSRNGSFASAVPNWSRQHFSTKEDCR